MLEMAASGRRRSAWRHVENAVFIAAFAYLLYGAVASLAHYSWATLGHAGRRGLHRGCPQALAGARVLLFAEGYYTAPLQLLILMVLGVQPAMLLVIMSVEVSWGTFIHAGERSLRHGRLGLLRFVIRTPAHHRVRHARNPLYLDRNFCTRQLPQDEIRIEYGIQRGVDVTHFVDFYFGECLLLWQDLRDASGLRNRLLLALKPPGWRPDSDAKTATGMRARFLADNPHLARVNRFHAPHH